jgi:hypothetical protein
MKKQKKITRRMWSCSEASCVFDGSWVDLVRI